MPVSRTVSGLVDEISCDSLKGWVTWNNIGSYFAVLDSADKMEGSAALKVYGYTPLATYAGEGYATPARWVNMTAGQMLRAYHKSDDTNHDWGLRIWGEGGNTYVIGPLRTFEGWTIHRGTIPNVLWGHHYTQQLQVYSRFGSNLETPPDPPGYGQNFTDRSDHIVICSNSVVTVTGLQYAQKVELYRASDNVKLSENTCQYGQTQIAIDIDSFDFPLYCYFKIYASDHITLIEQTVQTRICGGDTWYWTSPYGNLTLASDALIIIRQGGDGTPKEAHIIATLETPTGDPAPSKLLNFASAIGSCSPSSGLTNSSGQVSTIFSSTTHGVAVVKASWAGDADVPAAVTYARHHVLYTTEVADSSKNFQVFVEGVKLPFADGSYSLSMETYPQDFSVVIPEWNALIVPRGLVSIYRLGVKEFSGVFLIPERSSSERPRVTLAGLDNKCLLTTRVVTLKDYLNKTLGYIIEDLLTSYPCAITIGEIGVYPTPLTATFADETLVSSVSRLATNIGWLYRITADNKLDMNTNFGVQRSEITFKQGVNLFKVDTKENYGTVSNHIRTRGNSGLVSTQFDPASIEGLDILEEVIFQKSITVQSTLDIAANAELQRKVGISTAITAEVLDEYDPGAWGVDDWVTLECSEVDLSGAYKVVKITRRLSDPVYAQVDFMNKFAVDLADVLGELTRQLKDLSAA